MPQDRPSAAPEPSPEANTEGLLSDALGALRAEKAPPAVEILVAASANPDLEEQVGLLAPEDRKRIFVRRGGTSHLSGVVLPFIPDVVPAPRVVSSPTPIEVPLPPRRSLDDRDVVLIAIRVLATNIAGDVNTKDSSKAMALAIVEMIDQGME